LLLSQGVPMLLAGDEIGRTQHGNTNAYCQDSETSWVDWSGREQEADFAGFARALAGLRRDHPVFRRRRFFRGPDGSQDGPSDIAWLTPSGREMMDGDWKTGYAKSLGVFLNGDAITEPGPRGEPVRDDSFLLLFCADGEAAWFTLPGSEFGRRWEVVLDTAGAADGERPAAATIQLAARSMVVLRRIAGPAGRAR
ncbi:MAG: glycogen debranching enzyme, partial [Streptosporangiales bacterium]